MYSLISCISGSGLKLRNRIPLEMYQRSYTFACKGQQLIHLLTTKRFAFCGTLYFNKAPVSRANNIHVNLSS